MSEEMINEIVRVIANGYSVDEAAEIEGIPSEDIWAISADYSEEINRVTMYRMGSESSGNN